MSISIDLSARVALVTGGASGIGRTVAEQYAEAGASVVIADLDGGAAEVAAKQIGANARGVFADVTDEQSLRAAVAVAVDEFGGVDILSCNAGLTSSPLAVTEADPDLFDRIFAVNVKGPWLSARAVVPAMRARGGGVITITGSVMGERARPGFGAYAPSKAAANHLARVLALELAADNIRVNALAPVATDTPMLPMFLGSDEPEVARERFVAGIPMGRLAVPADIAAVAVFLASDAAAFMTGAVVPVDGGRSV